MLELLKEKKSYAKLSKCDGIAVDSSKVDDMFEWETLKSITNIRSFLGLAGYYRRFIEVFSKLVVPLTQLTRTGQACVWDFACEWIFVELKKKLTTYPFLIPSSTTGPFVMYCDASKMGQGGVLMQNGQVLAYASRQLRVH
ncbi:uncharacterized mitochondrial protein AtMg00860-like [Lathyrus oleraceus]|uniref:uncharacterized mitochondrial protein AtMg00860-like n=1 Tax=Pisum sativum TaxID=3888 RepID=UPI0021CE5E09|nr:uncharacterized mitochondrial protein AtMg00860-like [Pisum sativum]